MVVADETVVLTTPESVVALSLSDGTEQWRRSLTPATVPSVVGIGETPASPVLSNGRVFLHHRRVAEEFMAEHGNVNVTVDSTGSGGGIVDYDHIRGIASVIACIRFSGLRDRAVRLQQCRAVE